MKIPGTASRKSHYVDESAAHIHKAIDSLTHRVRPVVDSVTSGAHDATGRAAHATTHAAEVLSHKGDQLIHAQDKLIEDCRIYVRGNPLTVIALAVAAGCLINWWARRK